jgi:hypothetical protein
MRPISLHVEGFTCFREPQEMLDFSELVRIPAHCERSFRSNVNTDSDRC